MSEILVTTTLRQTIRAMHIPYTAVIMGEHHITKLTLMPINLK
jgi:hypothetical protein